MPALLTLVADDAAIADATTDATPVPAPRAAVGAAPSASAHARRSHPADGADDPGWVHRAWVHRPRSAARVRAATPAPRTRMPRASLLADERGAVTAEYAIIILAGVALAGVLVAIVRSGEVRQMLVDLVQHALGSAG